MQRAYCVCRHCTQPRRSLGCSTHPLLNLGHRRSCPHPHPGPSFHPHHHPPLHLTQSQHHPLQLPLRQHPRLHLPLVAFPSLPCTPPGRHHCHQENTTTSVRTHPRRRCPRSMLTSERIRRRRCCVEGRDGWRKGDVEKNRERKSTKNHKNESGGEKKNERMLKNKPFW